MYILHRLTHTRTHILHELAPTANTSAPACAFARIPRQREFEMAEIEHFLRFNDSTHEHFDQVAHLVLAFWPARAQEAGTGAEAKSLGDAVADGLVSSQALAYYLGRTALFLEKCGLAAVAAPASPHTRPAASCADGQGGQGAPAALALDVRFRQHRDTEMAHYAADCWDAEVHTSAFGWIEVVGHADRASYDLDMHSKATATPLSARADLADHQRVVRTIVKPEVNRAAIGKALRASAPAVIQELERIASEEPARALAAVEHKEILLTLGGEQVHVSCGDAGDSMVRFLEVETREHGFSFLPRVVEPSFGLDRLLYCTLEKSFYIRPADHQRTVLGLPAIISPFKCLVTGLSQSPLLAAPVAQIHRDLRSSGISCRVDESTAAIGRRYARNDEIGVPFAVTVDFAHSSDACVTVCLHFLCVQERARLVPR